MLEFLTNLVISLSLIAAASLLIKSIDYSKTTGTIRTGVAIILFIMAIGVGQEVEGGEVDTASYVVVEILPGSYLTFNVNDVKFTNEAVYIKLTQQERHMYFNMERAEYKMFISFVYNSRYKK